MAPVSQSPRDRVITVRIPTALYDRLPSHRRSAFIRDAIAAHLDGRAAITAEDRGFLIELTQLLRISSVNINQVARAIHSRSYNVPPPTADDLGNVIESIAETSGAIHALVASWERGT